jgi:hypothetical protein
MITHNRGREDLGYVISVALKGVEQILAVLRRTEYRISWLPKLTQDFIG